MKQGIFFRLAVILVLMQVLAGCTENVRGASPQIIEKLVKTEADSISGKPVWFAPELQVRHFRTEFYGYNTVYYRLMALGTDQPGKTSFRLIIDANYGGAERRYELALIDGASYPTDHLRHDTERCQLFNNMYSACLYRDRADVELDLAKLEAGRHSGLETDLDIKDYRIRKHRFAGGISGRISACRTKPKRTIRRQTLNCIQPNHANNCRSINISIQYTSSSVSSTCALGLSFSLSKVYKLDVISSACSISAWLL